jgi:hypothetical protein
MDIKIDWLAIQTIILAITLAIVCWQAIQTQKALKTTKQSTDLTRKTLEISSLISVKMHTQEINKLLFEHKDISEQLTLASRERLLAVMFLNNFELRCLLNELGILSKEIWDTERQTIITNLQQDFIQRNWDDRMKPEYHKAFILLVEEVLGNKLLNDK